MRCFYTRSSLQFFVEFFAKLLVNQVFFWAYKRNSVTWNDSWSTSKHYEITKLHEKTFQAVQASSDIGFLGCSRNAYNRISLRLLYMQNEQVYLIAQITVWLTVISKTPRSVTGYTTLRTEKTENIQDWPSLRLKISKYHHFYGTRMDYSPLPFWLSEVWKTQPRSSATQMKLETAAIALLALCHTTGPDVFF